MAKLGGKLLAFAAVAGAIAAGVSYAMQYKSFHKELEEDFHEFEDDFDDLGREIGPGRITDANDIEFHYIFSVLSF